MFLKLSVTHTHSPNFGFTLKQNATDECINFDSVFRFFRREQSNCTVILFQEGTMIGVSESPDEIMAKLK